MDWATLESSLIEQCEDTPAHHRAAQRVRETLEQLCEAHEADAEDLALFVLQWLRGFKTIRREATPTITELRDWLRSRAENLDRRNFHPARETEWLAGRDPNRPEYRQREEEDRESIRARLLRANFCAAASYLQDKSRAENNEQVFAFWLSPDAEHVNRVIEEAKQYRLEPIWKTRVLAAEFARLFYARIGSVRTSDVALGVAVDCIAEEFQRTLQNPRWVVVADLLVLLTGKDVNENQARKSRSPEPLRSHLRESGFLDLRSPFELAPYNENEEAPSRLLAPFFQEEPESKECRKQCRLDTVGELLADGNHLDLLIEMVATPGAIDT